MQISKIENIKKNEVYSKQIMQISKIENKKKNRGLLQTNHANIKDRKHKKNDIKNLNSSSCIN